MEFIMSAWPIAAAALFILVALAAVLLADVGNHHRRNQKREEQRALTRIKAEMAIEKEQGKTPYMRSLDARVREHLEYESYAGGRD